MGRGRDLRRRLSAVVLALAALAALGASATSAASPRQPSGANLASRDGCQRNNIGVGFVTSPQWVYVYRDRTIRKATGISHVTRR